jgi:hypothetical protein
VIDERVREEFETGEFERVRIPAAPQPEEDDG